MPARSFEEAVAAAKEPDLVEEDDLERLAQEEEEAFLAKVMNGVEEHYAPPPSHVPSQPAMPSPMQDAQQMMAMMVSQNNQLMQANQALQQQVMTLTQQLTAISAQLAAGGGIAHPQQRTVKRAEQMSEDEQWKHMHGEGGLLG